MFNGADIKCNLWHQNCWKTLLFFFSFNYSVAKKKSLFDDRPMEIQELTYIIKQVQGSSCFFFNYNDMCSCVQ